MSGLTTQLWWAGAQRRLGYRRRLCGAWVQRRLHSTQLWRAGVQRQTVLATQQLNFHSESSIYSSQWFTCLASHTSRSNSPVTHPSYFFLFQDRREKLSRYRNKKSRSNFGRKTKYAFAGRLLQTINQGSQEGLQNQRSEMRTISLDPKDEEEE
uniref:Uncharacterized protein n=1 Tax=Brassica oleracea var. oleracea TaxID=109376 RepID=A0A0D3A751_BRAOL